jgi:hypothetical protein
VEKRLRKKRKERKEKEKEKKEREEKITFAISCGSWQRHPLAFAT